MSTHDVPGANATNNDELAMGCWAEHEDGSLIFVESTEGDRVVYSMFDVSQEPVMEYRDAMDGDDFKGMFSWPGDSGEKWTWHDKTPFPWDRVIKDFPSGARFASVETVMTAAQRVAERLGLTGRGRDAGDYSHLIDDLRKDANDIIKRIQDAVRKLRP